MHRWLSLLPLALTGLPAAAQEGGGGLTVTPTSLTFTAVINGAIPASKTISVTATRRTGFAASVVLPGNVRHWLAISPTSNLATNQALKVSVTQAGLTAGSYQGSIEIASKRGNQTVAVTFSVSASSGGGGAGGGGGNTAGYKLIGWNDLGMHCFDGADYSVFGVLPPYNTFHAHLLDSTGKLIVSPTGYAVTYQAINDPLTNTMNATSVGKTNFWTYAAQLGFGALAPDVGLKGYAMPGPGNTPKAMGFSTTDNTFIAEGVPMTPFPDAPSGVSRNYFPMMRLTAKNSSGTTLATTDIVVPTSDEMTCSTCHSSSASSNAARPANGWANVTSNPARDVKINILRKHDDRFKTTLEASVATKPLLCGSCHATNALGLAGVGGVEPLTTAMHKLHAGVTDPATSATLDAGTTRNTCYNCHPGPNTQCLRGTMANIGIDCQNCHGNMSAVAVATRQGWLDEPNCQACHTGTAAANSGQIVYTSALSGGTLRAAADQTFATNANTPAAGVSLYRYSQGHGGLECEACHGSTHAEYITSISNDNVQSTSLQGHAGTIAECASCHGSVPNTVNGGPHGLHPIGTSWVNGHQDAAEKNRAACQGCHGTDYRGTILSKTQADRTMAGHSFPRGTIIGCYSCHNGPNGG